MAGQGQDCPTEVLLKQPGHWTQGLPSSMSGIPPADLAKEKKIVNSIIEPIQKKYTPKGLDILYGGAYGAQSRLPSHLHAGHYYYAYFYFLEHDCPYDKEAMRSKHFAGYLSIIANDFGLEFGRTLFVPSKPYEENPWTDAYVLLEEPPVKTDMGWYWKEGGDDAYTTVDYRYLITADNKVPFVHISKKEYAWRLKEYFQKKINETERNYAQGLKSGEETYEQLKKINTKDASTFKQQNDMLIKRERESSNTIYKNQIQLIDKFLQTADAGTLADPAIIDHVKGESEFYGFVDAAHPYAAWPIRPNPDYFKKELPSSSPQFLTVQFNLYTEDKETVYDVAFKELIKIIDFASLKAMIGK